MNLFNNLFGKRKQVKTEIVPDKDNGQAHNDVKVNFKICSLLIEGFPFELMLNTALLDAKLRKDFTWLWTITLQSFENNEGGLPEQEEKEKLFKLMQDIINEMLKESEIQIVGTTTHKGIYDIMFYAKEEDAGTIGGNIAEMPTFLEDQKDRFGNYTGKKDENWELTKGYFSLFEEQA